MEVQANLETVQPAPVVPPPNAPRCCRHQMDLLSRGALLHGDGQVDYHSVWYCQQCGRMVL